MNGKCRGCAGALYDATGATVRRIHDEAECLASKLEQCAHEKEALEQLLATAYQLAGLVGAPVRFLDAYALHDDVDIDSLLPVTLDELDEFKALQSKLDEVTKERDALQEEIDGQEQYELCDCCGCLSTETVAEDGEGNPLGHSQCPNCGKIAGLEADLEAMEHDLEKVMDGRNTEANARIAAECRLDSLLDGIRGVLTDWPHGEAMRQNAALLALVTPVVEKLACNHEQSPEAIQPPQAPTGEGEH